MELLPYRMKRFDGPVESGLPTVIHPRVFYLGDVNYLVEEKRFRDRPDMSAIGIHLMGIIRESHNWKEKVVQPIDDPELDLDEQSILREIARMHYPHLFQGR